MIRSAEQCACPLREIGPSMAGSCGPGMMLFMSILEAFINGRCDLADPCRRVDDAQPFKRAYDFVVVGGGTAGAVVAARLSENPAWSVLLLEAGGDEPVASSVPAFVVSYWDNPETNWMYNTEPQERACLSHEKPGECQWPRGKMLGGSSVINGMMYMRGHSADYDAWDRSGVKGWSWTDVLPYFLKSEDNKEIGRVTSALHNKGGPLPVQRFRHRPEFAEDLVTATAELGLPQTDDLNGFNITGFTIAQALNDGGSRYSSARAFLRPALHRENLHVLLHALGARALFHPGTKRVSGLEFYHEGVRKTVDVQKELIFSGGTINSPQMLLLSGIGPRETLDKFNIPLVHELRGVGHNLQNHVGVNLDFTLDKELDTRGLDWTTAMEYVLKREGPMSSTGMSQLTGIMNSKHADPSGKHPDLQYFFSGFYAGCASTGELNAAADPDAPEAKRSIGISVINLHPNTRGYLTLKSTDPFEPPLMQPNYLFDPRDIDVLIDGARTAYAIANTTLLREKYGMRPTEGYASECEQAGPMLSDEYLRCLIMHQTAPENHQVGTCAMGPEWESLSVLDEKLQVRGVEGLRVIDASAMPTVPSGNTAAPVIMIAERGSEFIITKYQSSKTGVFENRFKPEIDTSNNGGIIGGGGGSGGHQWGSHRPWHGDDKGSWTGDWGHGGFKGTTRPAWQHDGMWSYYTPWNRGNQQNNKLHDKPKQNCTNAPDAVKSDESKDR